jgi:DNA-binding GntR family transcriptional regulator
MTILHNDVHATIRPAAIEGRSEDGDSLSAKAYARITDMIRRRELAGGETIVEQRIAGALGISRTPLREALQRLEGEGLVMKRSNRSFVVRHVDLAEYLHSLKVRDVLEPEAVAIAVTHLRKDRVLALKEEAKRLEALPLTQTDDHWAHDDALHGLFLDACGNPVLARLVRELRVTTRLFEIACLPERVLQDRAEHEDILAAAAEGDARAARRAMAAHLRSLSRYALATVQ